MGDKEEEARRDDLTQEDGEANFQDKSFPSLTELSTDVTDTVSSVGESVTSGVTVSAAQHAHIQTA